MKILFISGLLILTCVCCFAQTTSQLIEADINEFKQSIDKFPALLTKNDWKLINQKAEIAFENQNYTRALAYFIKAQIVAEKFQDDFLIAKSFHQLARTQVKLNNQKEAEEYYKLSTDSFIRLLRVDKSIQNLIEFGYLLNDWAFTYSNPNFIHEAQDIAKALALLNQSLRIATSEKLKGTSNYADDLMKLQILTTLRISNCFGITGNFPTQIIWLEKNKSAINNLPTSTQMGLKDELFDTYFGLQSAYRNIGNYNDSAENLTKLENLTKTIPKNVEYELRYLREQAEFEFQISNLKARDSILLTGSKLAAKSNTLNQLSDFYSVLMLNSLKMKNLKTAEEFLNLLETLSKKDSLSVNKLDIAVAKAVIAGYKGNAQESREYFEISHAILKNFGNEWMNSLFLMIWESRIAQYQNDYRRLKQISDDYLKTASEKNSKDSLPLIYVNLARANLGLENISEAQKFNQTAIDLIEAKRISNSAQISTGVMESLYEAYQQKIALNLAEKQTEAAFKASEFLKGRWLRDKISNNPINQKVVIDEKTQPEIYDASLAVLQNSTDEALQKRLSDLEKKALFNDSKVNELSENDGQDLIKNLENSSIGPDTAIVSHVFTDDDHLAAFVWQKGKPLKVTELSLTRAEAEKLAVDITGKIKDFLFFKQDGLKVYNTLLRPLNISPEIKQLIIIPDKSLWKIPFQALSSDGKTYLIEEKLITYAPSVTVLLSQLKDSRPERKSFQVFANSTVDKYYLKFADREARDLANSFNVAPILNARVSDFLIRAESSDIIHFSMHAEVTEGEPFNSYLAFKPEGTDNGQLTVEELLKLKLKKGSLAFLASCETSNVLSAEGLISLSWGLMAAGSTTVISAQWEANDESSAMFTENFYKHLRSGLSPGAALQKTSQEMIHSRAEKFNAPYFWAEFTLSGDYR